MRKVMIGGAPQPMAYVPHRAMLAEMRAAQAFPTARNPAAEDTKALEYARFLCRRDCVQIPAETVTRTHGAGIRAVVIRDWPANSRHDRPRAVEWQEGEWRTSREVVRWRRRKGKQVQVTEREGRWHAPCWKAEKVVLRVDIPHWDWEPIVHQVAA
jgi:hypothetical protein